METETGQTIDISQESPSEDEETPDSAHTSKRKKYEDPKPISAVERIEQQILDDDDMYQSMNAELDKQIAEDMEAIKTYLNNPDKSMAKRMEFFNKMDQTKVTCHDAPITDHILYQHTPLGNIKWHECTQCEYKAQEKSKLMEHLMISHSSLANGDQFTCPRCSFKAKNNSDLQEHLYEVHNQGQKFNCKECDKAFYVNSELLKHMEDVHNAEVFKCGQCSFIIGDRAALRHHTLTEHVKLNVSWYKCAQCAYRTVRKANLDRHIMYKHSINTILL